MAQQDRPSGSGQSAFLRDQLISASTRLTKTWEAISATGLDSGGAAVRYPGGVRQDAPPGDMAAEGAGHRRRHSHQAG